MLNIQWKHLSSELWLDDEDGGALTVHFNHPRLRTRLEKLEFLRAAATAALVQAQAREKQ